LERIISFLTHLLGGNLPDR